MTSIWQTGWVFLLAGMALALAWVATLLSRQISAARAAADLLSRRIDALSLRVRRLETARSHNVSSSSTVRQRRNFRTDGATSAAESGKTLITVPSLASGGSEATAAVAAGELARRFGAIWDMADRGQPIAEIAQETGHPVGQVELILGLRRSSVSALSAGGKHGQD